MYLYRPMLRPASFCTLPRGVEWDYVEAPAISPDIARRRGLPLSVWTHGIISTNRELTREERENFDIALA
jgi:hypothetical protein